MNDVVLVYESMRRHKGRTVLLAVTVAIAFLVYGMLGTLRYSLRGGEDEFAETRLIVTHQAGLTEPLPMSYRSRLRAIDGVAEVGHATWFGAYYQTQKQMLMAFAVDPAVWLAQHPEMEVAPEAARRFLSAKDGMLVSEALAEKFGWKVGEVVPLQSILFFPSDGGEFWSFRVSGLFRSKESGGGRNYIIMHYDYLNENRVAWPNTVGTYMVTAKPGVGLDGLATAIDEQFSTAESRTSTATDRAFHSAFFSQFGDVALLIRTIVLVSFVSMLFVVASTITVTVRQRTREIGVLKVLGFSNPRVLRLIFGETLALTAAGAAAGLLASAVTVAVLTDRLPTLLPDVALPARVLAEAGAIVVLVGLAAGCVPALLALRMRPVEAFAGEP